MKKIVRILKTDFVTHDVKRFILEKPNGYNFIPGQATHVSVNKGEWKHEERPFTFTCLNNDLVLEFTIKRYDEHKGVTKEIHSLKPGDELIIRDVFGTINYKGKGTFIAGGAGITPFIAILRQLRQDEELAGNKLIFSNKTAKDIILERELEDMFKDNPQDLILTLTDEARQGYENKFVDEEFLKKYINNFKQNIYLCGPPKMVEALTDILKKLGADVGSVVFEGKS